MATAPPLAPERRELRLEFGGRAGEYFRIWIVNLALTLVTLGIYSAWAKVRTRKYFYGNLRLEGSAFEYTADPVRILIGRILVAVFAAAYVFATGVMPLLAGAFALLFFVATPWLAVRALSFNHRNTRWRNLRFSFRGRYRDAARAYLGWGILSALTLGICVPVAHQRRHAFLVANSRYGSAAFSFTGRAREYYGPYLAALAVVGVGLVAMLIAIAALVGTAAVRGGDEASAEGAGQLAGFLGLIPMALAYAAALVLVQARTTNLLYASSSLEGNRFRCELRFGELLGLYAMSAVAIALTFGMLIPWARIRLARYRASRLTLLVVGDLGGFVAAAEKEGESGAFADEAAVAFDFDFGL